jgi:hypothetical protein
MRPHAASLLAIALFACRSSPQQLKPQNRIATSPASGAVSAKLVPDPNSPELKLAPGEEYIAPQLRPGNPPPEYPSGLVPLHLPPHIVSVRVTFDEYSHVIDIARSPVGQSTNDEHQPAFEEAVRSAVKRWICYPAKIRRFRDGPDNDGDGKPDYRIMTAERFLKTFFDVTFTFEVINGHPVVKSGG